MITVQFKILPTFEQEKLLSDSANEYINCVNQLVNALVATATPAKLSSATVQASLPSAVKNEAINAAKSVVKKYRKDTTKVVPVLKKPVITWNNQNYKLSGNTLSFPLWIDGKSKRISVSVLTTEYQMGQLCGKFGSLRITQKNGKWMAQIAVDVPSETASGDAVLGVDLGLKVPAVVVTNKGKTRFFGNGRQIKYMKRKYRSKRKALGKSKKQHAIKKLNNKEQRWMKDQDHKVSRQIVDFAKNNSVSEIHLEQLQNIRNTARTSRKNAKSLHTWSFYRLAMFVAYKAEMLGIKVVSVNPKYTSQTCPSCGERNHAKDRQYRCKCGFKSHRDRVGAMDIIHAPVASGKRKPA